MSLSVDSALRKAQTFEKRNDLVSATAIYQDILARFPANQRAITGYKRLQNNAKSEPSSEQIQNLVTLFNQGQLEATIAQSQTLIDNFPNSPTLWNVLGVATTNLGRFERASTAFETMIDLKPDHAEAHYLLGNALASQNALQAAITAYQNALKINPNYAEAYNGLGNVLQITGQTSAAIDAFTQAVHITPGYAAASYNLANAFIEQDNHDAAIKAYKTALSAQPDFAEAHNNLGYGYERQGNLDDAITSYAAAVSNQPDSACYHYNLGNAHHLKGAAKAAITAFEKAITLMPDYADAYNGLGSALREIGNLDGAIEAMSRAISLRPDCAKTNYNMGNAYADADKWPDAITAYQTALALKPDYAEAHNNIGFALKNQNKLNEALAAYQTALAIKPDYADAHHNLGMAHLKSQAFIAAWPEMEWRWSVKSRTCKPLLSQKPLWQGGRVERLLVWAEQGIGDEIMFNACLPQIAQQCDRLIVSASKRLIPLFERSFNDITFVEAHNKIDEALYDLQAPALTALGQCRTSLDDFRATATPYLHADAARADTIKSRLKTLAGGAPIIGISWKSMNEKLGKRRSLDLPALAAAIPPDAFLVSLQYGDVAEEIAALKTATGRIVHSYDGVDNFSDLDGFAALVSACDQVISIDNSTVHFAGALGIACHILLPFNPDWRWGLHGTKTSYWYAKTHLHWQPSPNDWQGCIDSLQTCFSAQRQT